MIFNHISANAMAAYSCTVGLLVLLPLDKKMICNILPLPWFFSFLGDLFERASVKQLSTGADD